MMEAKFELGRLVATPGALEALSKTKESPSKFLKRHMLGDWGEICAADRQENKRSLEHGYRLMSVYRTTAGKKLWVITEADRSVTTILLPEEY